MNSFTTFGIFAFLFAHCTPTQGEVVFVSNVEFESGRECTTTSNKSLYLTKSSSDTYSIEQTEYENGAPKISAVATFKISGIDTMLEFDSDVVLRINNNSFLRMSLVSSQDARQLLAMTSTLSSLGGSLYSYPISAVYEFQKGKIHENVHLAGFDYPIARYPHHRYIIHSGAPSTQPHLLWTANEFDYHAHYDAVVMTLRLKPAQDKYKYYLLKFRKATDTMDWMNNYGRHRANIPTEPTDVYNYFRQLMRT